MHGTLILYLSLLVVIVLLVMLAARIKVSYPIILVVAGLLLGFVPFIPEVSIDPELIFLIFLPPLLYEAAWSTSWKDLWKWRRVITSFAFLIVILTSCVIAFVSSALIPGFSLALGFLLGGIISPPDAVSATSILKAVKVPRAMSAIIEGESLLNDASSLVIFRFALVAVETGRFVFSEATGNFALVIILGCLVGLAIAALFYLVHRWLPTDANIDIVLTFITPYVMYIAAEELKGSGVLAVVCGGLFLSMRSQQFLSTKSRIQAFNLWSTLVFVLNGLVFLLIGLELPIIVNQLGNTSLGDAIKYGLIISAVLICTRLVFVFATAGWTRFIGRYIQVADKNPGWKGPLIIGWAGMRGVVSLAAALSIPMVFENGTAFPQRNLVLFITFIVIMVTLLLQGLTLPILIRWLGLKDKEYTLSAEEQELVIRKRIAATGLKVLQEKYARKLDENDFLKSLQKKLETDHVMLCRLVNESAEENNMDHYFTDFHEVIKDIISEQRKTLKAIEHEDEIETDSIRKYDTILNLEEEKMRLQFGKES